MIYVKEREERSVSEMLQNGQISNNRKTIRVVAAVIRRGNQIFASQRGYGDYKDWWEFPGGKIEAGETPEAALVREIREELDAEITVDEYIMTVEYDYPEFHLSMDCYWCRLKNEHLTLLEHEASKWLRMDDLGQVNWLPADVLVVKAIGTKSNGTIQTAEGCEGKADRHFHFLNREERVAFYEQIYDELLKRIHENGSFPEEVRMKALLLDEYYTSGKWQEDYEADEAGLLPEGLKRGVLSQDGVYDLLTEWQAENNRRR